MTAAAGLPELSAVERRLLGALHDVEDAELPLDVVDLGLIYGLDYVEDAGHVDVRMTFTAMGCPAMEFMVDDVRERLLAEPDVSSVRVEIVWDPPWDRTRLTERGAAALSTWGIV
jgi:metal-sulfur cluster biosynthetic enzyme